MKAQNSKKKRQKIKRNERKKAKMKWNETQKGKNESKWSPRRPKWKEMKAQRAQNRVSLGVAYADPISKMAHTSKSRN